MQGAQQSNGIQIIEIKESQMLEGSRSVSDSMMHEAGRCKQSSRIALSELEVEDEINY